MSEDIKKLDDLDNVRVLLARHKQACEAVAPENETAGEDATVEQPTEHLGELRTLLERTPLGEIARIIEAIDPDDRLLVWREVREERGRIAARNSLRRSAPGPHRRQPPPQREDRGRAFEFATGV